MNKIVRPKPLHCNDGYRERVAEIWEDPIGISFLAKDGTVNFYTHEIDDLIKWLQKAKKYMISKE